MSQGLAVAVRPVGVKALALTLVLLAGLPAIRFGWLTPKAWVIAGAIAWIAAVLVFLDAYDGCTGAGRRRKPGSHLLSPVGASRCVYALQWRASMRCIPSKPRSRCVTTPRCCGSRGDGATTCPTISRRSAGCSSRAALLRGCRSRRPSTPIVAAVLPSLRRRLRGLRQRCSDCRVPLVARVP